MTRRSNQRTLLVISIVLMAFLSSVSAKIIYVDANAPGPIHDGSSWENAYKYLQDALADANSSTKPVEIHVAQGIYKPDQTAISPPPPPPPPPPPGGLLLENWSGVDVTTVSASDRTATFQLINGVSIKGGYAGFSEPNPNARDIGLYETILSGDLAGNDTEVDDLEYLLYDPCRVDNSYRLVTGNWTDANAVLDGFTITAGNNSRFYHPAGCGAGMYIYEGSAIVRNCKFSYNAAGFKGGGMFNDNYPSGCDYCIPKIENCTFIYNCASSGGGMYNWESNPAISNCKFIENMAEDGHGGGVRNLHSHPIVTNCLFTRNSAINYSAGGGMSNSLSSPLLTNCTFTGNSAPTGGGIGNNSSSPILTNCLFIQNSADKGGGGIDNYHSSGYNGTATNCILWGNMPDEIRGSANITYSDIKGGWPGLGNIDIDPCFVDPCNDNYHLREDSLCINAGDPNYIAGPNETDLDGKPRISGGRIDMGAYEYQELTILYVDANAPGPIHDGSSWTNAYQYLQDALTDAGSATKPVEIRVAQGIYKPDQNVTDPNGSGSRGATFQLINGVSLTGGYAGLDQPDPNARDIKLYETILSGDLNGDDIPIYPHNKEDNSYHVTTGSGTNTNSILDGFTICGSMGTGMYNYEGSPAVVNCTFSDNTANDGGAMYNIHFSYPVVTNCEFSLNRAGENGGAMCNEDSNPVVTGCTFIDNSALHFGGAVYNEGNNPTFKYCTFNDNLAQHGGGGMYNNYSSPILTNCTFERNWSGLSGGGLDTVMESSNPILIGCRFIGNSADGRGGGTSNGTSSLTLINCIFIENSAMYGAGGMYSCSGRSINVINCTFYGNTAPNGNLLVCSCQPSNVQFTNCIMWDGGNEIWNPRGSIITLTYNDMYGGRMSVYDPCESMVWGESNIDTDPCFIDANNSDYHLKSQAGRWDANSQSWVKDNVTSPCIDAGNPGCPVDDEPAPNGNRRNIGAYGVTAEASKSPTYWRSIADTTNDWMVDSNDLKVFADYWLQTGECIPCDFDRSQSVDFNDFAIFGGQWSQKGPGPGITYDIGGCIPVDFPSSTTEEPNETRFTVTVVGSNIHFEDMMRANCCPEELDVQMTLEDNLITIYEIERFFTRIPCPCICDYPINATLGPFGPGTYSLVVYQKSSFIGSTTVTIEDGR